MTPQTLTPAELDELAALEAKATPGEWAATAHGAPQERWWTVNKSVGMPRQVARIMSSFEHDARLIAALRNHAPALLSMARRLGEVSAENAAIRAGAIVASTAEQAREMGRWIERAEMAEHAHDACEELLTAATAREDALGSRIMEIVDDALGLQEVDSSPIHMLDMLEKRFHEHRVEATRAKCADALQATLDEIAHIVGAVHDQMTGPSYPGTTTEVIAAVAALGAANRADAEARELNVVLAKYVIYVHPRQKDNACSRCMATEPLPNFVCGWHRAADIVDALDPERHR